VRDLVEPEPIEQLVERARGRAEGLHLAAYLAPLYDPFARHDGVLMHVQPGTTLMNQIHVTPPYG
jgi:hypothetical protein